LFGIYTFRYSVNSSYKISSHGDIPTLKIGRHVTVSKLAYDFRFPIIGKLIKRNDPVRGDLIVFIPPDGSSKFYVKRVIGVPGDKIRIAGDRLYINERLVEKEQIPFSPTMDDIDNKEEYNSNKYALYNENLEGTKHLVLQAKDRDSMLGNFSIEIKITENSYFVMGENRDNSIDSRVFGLVGRNSIIGKVTLDK